MTTLRRQMKNMVKNYSEAEVKVREATSNDPWGPSSTLMSEISDLTYNIVALGEVMRMMWKRLNDHGKNWRHVYKSLVLLDYLVKNGNEKVAQQCKEHIVAIQTLKDFQFMDEQKDQGQSVRDKAKQLVNLLRDDERLKQERAKAFRARERYAQNAMGISSDNKMTYGTQAIGAQGMMASTPGRMGAASMRSSGNYADPYGGAHGGLSPEEAARLAASLAPDLEAVRPSDANEEDLQIKLAIMLSQQEHEDDVQKKRNDDAKLQLALEQSKTEGQPNGLVDLADFDTYNNRHPARAGASSMDPWGSSGNQYAGTAAQSDTDSDDFFPQSANASASADPWGSAATAKPAPQQHHKDPWSSNGADAWASAKPRADDAFDMFSNARTAPTTTAAAAVASDPFGDFFGGAASSTSGATPFDNRPMQSSASRVSTNPWGNGVPGASMPVMATTTGTSSTGASSSSGSSSASSAIRKTPESFLGENSSLVNLDNLIGSNGGSGIANRPKSTNPFGGAAIITPLSASTSTGQLSAAQMNNPFAAAQAANQAKAPTISQLQAAAAQQNNIQASRTTPNQFAAFGGFGSGPPPLPPSLIAAPPASASTPSNNSTNPFLMM